MAEGRSQRHWSDIALAVAALFVSAVSLWVAIRTENSNEELVAASVWPFLQVQVSNADPDTKLDLQFEVVNTGVGRRRSKVSSCSTRASHTPRAISCCAIAAATGR
jgi:hypothetical protein